MITLVRPKNMFGKRSKCFVAYTSSPAEPNHREICRGEPGESAAVVRKRAEELLTQALERQALEVRQVRLDYLDAPGGITATWIMAGDPINGYHYGVVDARNGGKATLRITCSGGSDLIRMLTNMLHHMADTYPEETWDQFLWSNTYAPWCEVKAVDVAAIRADIKYLNEQRSKMMAPAAPVG